MGKEHGSRTQKDEAVKEDEKWGREEWWSGLGMVLEVSNNIRDLGIGLIHSALVLKLKSR